MRPGLGTALAAILFTAAACDTFPVSLLRPSVDPNPDVTPPVFSTPRPPADVLVVSAEAFTIQVTDPGGSGVDPTRVEANVIGGGARPVTVLLPAVTVHLTGLADGPLQIAVVARDFAGNSGVYVFTATLDRTSPTLTFSTPPPAATSSAATTLRVDLSVRVGTEPNFEAGSLEVRFPGPDGTCGTTDDTSVAGQAPRLLPGVGTHAFSFVLTNPVSPFGQPQAILYCWIATARDTARTIDGAPGANTARAVTSTLVTWLPPPG